MSKKRELSVNSESWWQKRARRAKRRRTNSVRRITGWEGSSRSWKKSRKHSRFCARSKKGVNTRMCRRPSGTTDMHVAQPWHKMQTRCRFGLVSNNSFVDPKLHASFLAVGGPLVREEQEKHLQFAQDALQPGVQGNHVQQEPRAAAYGSGCRCTFACFWVYWTGWIQQASFPAMGAKAHPQWSRQDTYHILHWGTWSPEEAREREQCMLHTTAQPQKEKAWDAWMEWEKSQSSTSRVLQAKQPYQRTKGWSKSQEQSSARITEPRIRWAHKRLRVQKIKEQPFSVDGPWEPYEECCEGTVVEMWTTCQEGVHIFAVYFWHSKGWSVRNEALMSTVLKRVANTRSHWTMAWIRLISLRAIGSRKPRLKSQHRSKDAPRTVLRAQEA